MSDIIAPGSPPMRPKAVKSVGHRLRIILWVVFGLIAALAPNSLFLAGIKWMGWRSGGTEVYEDSFYHWMFFAHILLGLVLIVPFLLFCLFHIRNTWNRKNWRAIRAGWAVFFVGLLVLITGVALPFPQLPQGAMSRQVVYWLHVLLPLGCLWMYWLHRLSGPKIKWRMGLSYLGVLIAVVGGMVFWKGQDPRGWNRPGPASAEVYFSPSLARTGDGKFISEHVLQNDEYCLDCHRDAYEGWFHSAHHFSSFNNPAYLASVRETRKVSLERDGDVKAARFCAGCHDPVPFFAGKFDDPKYDDRNDPTAGAGVTCTVCHAVTNINSTRGNADYTIEEPIHYPFAFSSNPFLKWINHQLIKAKPDFHKKTFLKPLHKTAEFCGSCHKVHLPEELNKYKWLRGQNHYDSHLLSGVSGHGARSFYYPEHSKADCNQCHMPLQPSSDFAAKDFDKSGVTKMHSHAFPSANTALGHWLGDREVVQKHEDFLQKVVRVDLFGIKKGGTIDGPLEGMLRPNRPALEPGAKYLLETVVRTTGMGHHFSQGTTDSNEIWLEVTLKSGGKIIGKSGGLDAADAVDPWSHFINVYMLDRTGKRVDRRNAQDIFTPLYNNQIPPGAGQIVHYSFEVPKNAVEPIEIEVALRYRKFDAKYIEFVREALPGDQWPIDSGSRPQPGRNDLPIVTMAMDRLTLPLVGAKNPTAPSPASSIPPWQRWNDYGIGLLLEGNMFSSKGELKQAAAAFEQVEKLGRYDGPLNLARVYQVEGRLDEAVAALERAARCSEPPAPKWTLNWLTGVVNRQQGRLEDAAENFRQCLNDRSAEALRRGFDFSKDYEVRFELGQTLFDLADKRKEDKRTQMLKDSVVEFEKVLALDAEHVGSHYRLASLYDLLGDAQKSAHHRRFHLKFKEDDNARDKAVQIARASNPAAARVADRIVIYPLQRVGAPGLDADHTARAGTDK